MKTEFTYYFDFLWFEELPLFLKENIMKWLRSKGTWGCALKACEIIGLRVYWNGVQFRFPRLHSFYHLITVSISDYHQRYNQLFLYQLPIIRYFFVTRVTIFITVDVFFPIAPFCYHFFYCAIFYYHHIFLNIIQQLFDWGIIQLRGKEYKSNWFNKATIGYFVGQISNLFFFNFAVEH